MKLHKIILAEQDIRELMQRYVYAIKNSSISKQQRYKSMIYVRLADLGFDRPHIKNMIIDLTDVGSEKELDKFISRYRLWGEDYAASFRPTEATITESEREEDEDGVEQNVHTFKIILQVPFATAKNKDQKLRKLKFDFMILDIKIKNQKDIDVAKVNPEAIDNPVLDYAIMLEIETEMTRTEIENELEPDYKILKMKEL